MIKNVDDGETGEGEIGEKIQKNSKRHASTKQYIGLHLNQSIFRKEASTFIILWRKELFHVTDLESYNVR